MLVCVRACVSLSATVGVCTCLQDFALEASNNQVVWTLLREHRNDLSLEDVFSNFTWTLEDPPVQVAYRYFRITQLDRNSGGQFYLSLSGFEVFGTLFGA
jgi:hypothetical protein